MNFLSLTLSALIQSRKPQPAPLTRSSAKTCVCTLNLIGSGIPSCIAERHCRSWLNCFKFGLGGKRSFQCKFWTHGIGKPHLIVLLRDGGTELSKVKYGFSFFGQAVFGVSRKL